MDLRSYYYHPSPFPAESPAPPTLTYLEKVLSTSPVAGWPMDDVSGNLADAVGSLDCVISGTPTYGATGPTIAGETQAAVLWPGNPTEGDADDPGITSSSISVMVWFKLVTQAQERHIASRRTTGNESWHLYWNPTRDGVTWRTVQTDGSTHADVILPSTTYDDDAWHGIILTMEDGVAALAYDDQSPVTAIASDTVFSGSWNFNTTAPIDIAHRGSAPEWIGGLCHLWLWDRLLDSTERTLLLTGV